MLNGGNDSNSFVSAKRDPELRSSVIVSLDRVTTELDE
jgi:hypothetical protein